MSKIEYDKVTIPDVDGWYNPATQKVIEGRLSGYRQFKDRQTGQKRIMVVLELLTPCKAESEGQEVELKAGQVVALTMRSQLEVLLDYIESRPCVKIESLGKKSIGGGRSVWQFDVGVQRGAKKNPRPQVDISDDEAS